QNQEAEMSQSDKTNKNSTRFTAEEKAAMKNRAKELKAEARASKNREVGENEVLESIAAMQVGDRVMAERIHAIIKASAPALSPKTWYGMPAYASGDKIICFFQPAQKFKTRYATLGFNDSAHLDDGSLWPVAYALTELTATEEAKISAL